MQDTKHLIAEHPSHYRHDDDAGNGPNKAFAKFDKMIGQRHHRIGVAGLARFGLAPYTPLPPACRVLRTRAGLLRGLV